MSQEDPFYANKIFSGNLLGYFCAKKYLPVTEEAKTEEGAGVRQNSLGPHKHLKGRSSGPYAVKVPQVHRSLMDDRFVESVSRMTVTGVKTMFAGARQMLSKVSIFI